MANYLSMDKNALLAEFDAVRREFEEIKGANLLYHTCIGCALFFVPEIQIDKFCAGFYNENTL